MKKRVMLLGAALVAFTSAFALEVRVQQTPNGPRIFKDGVEVAPHMFYCSDELRYADDNRDGLDTPFAKQILMAKAAGVDFITFNSIDATRVWIGDHTYDFHNLDRSIDLILKLNPKALFIPRIDMNSRPVWVRTGFWYKNHPELCMKFDPEGEDIPGVPSISSALYRQEACEFLRALIEHLEKKYPNNFAGIHPIAQESCEFFYWKSWERMSGFEDAVTQAYGTNLTYEVRCHAAHGLLRDPVEDRDAFRFTVWRNRAMADFIAQIARTCREATHGKKLVIFFYGYTWVFLGTPKGGGETGHYALGYLLKKAAGDIDIIVSPASYGDRAPGGPGTCQGAADTVMRNGVLWFNEDDIRTYLVKNNREAERVYGLCDTPQETIGVLRRQLAHEVIAGYGNWFMDLNREGWYADTNLWATIQQVKPLEEAVAKRNRGYQPEIALIIDEESICATTSSHRAGPMVNPVRTDLSNNGVSYGQYLLSDFLTDQLPFAKVHWFQAAWYLTEAERAALKEFRKTDKGIRVWSWAPGYLSAKGADVKGIEELTGFKVEAHYDTNGEGPDFHILDAKDDEIWLYWGNNPQNGVSCAARRSPNGSWDILECSPWQNAAFAKKLVEFSKLHRYVSDGSALVWADGNNGCVHAVTNGTVTVSLPDGRTKTLEMQKGDTAFFME